MLRRSAKPRAADYYRAVEAFGNGQDEEALRLFLKLSGDCPDHPNLCLWLSCLQDRLVEPLPTQPVHLPWPRLLIALSALSLISSAGVIGAVCHTLLSITLSAGQQHALAGHAMSAAIVAATLCSGTTLSVVLWLLRISRT